MHVRKDIKSELFHLHLLVGDVHQLLRLLFFAHRRWLIVRSNQQVLIQSLLDLRDSLAIGFDLERFQDRHVHILGLRRRNYDLQAIFVRSRGLIDFKNSVVFLELDDSSL